MPVDKQRLRALVFAHYEREVQTETRWNEERKQRELNRLKTLYDERMQREMAGEFRYFNSLEGEELEAELAQYAQDSDRSVTDRFGDYGAWREADEKFHRIHDTPAESFMKGLYDSRPDETELLMHFSPSKYDEQFRALQDEINAIEIPVPDGLEPAAIRYAVLGMFLHGDQALIDSYRQAQEQSEGGSSLWDVKNPADAARANFFANVIGQGEDRANMHFNRFAVPSARRSVQQMAQQYPQGGREELAQAVFYSFDACLNRISSTLYKGGQMNYFCAKTLKDCLDLLDREPLKGLVEIPEERRSRAAYFIAEQENFAEQEELRKELVESLAVPSFRRSPAKPMADPAFRAKAERFLALTYIQKSSADESNMLYTAMNADAEEKTQETLARRDLGIYESLMGADREAFIETIIEQRIRPETAEYEKLFEMDTGNAITLLEKTTGPTIPGGYNRYLVPLAENLFRGFSDFVSQHPEQRYAESCAKMQEVVCAYERLRRTEGLGLDGLDALLPAVTAVYDALEREMPKDTERVRMQPAEQSVANRLLDFSTSCRLIRDILPGTHREQARDLELFRAMEAKGVQLPEVCRKARMTPAEKQELARAAENARERTAEEQAAEAWFASFTEELQQRGISYENPLSLSFVKILNPEFDQDAFVALADGANTVETAQQVLRTGATVSLSAFLPASLRGMMPYQGDDYAGFLHDSMQDPAQLGTAEKLQLYRMAQEHRLYLEHPSMEPDASCNFCFAGVAEDGNARLTGYVGDLTVNTMHDPATYQEADWRNLEEHGFRRDEAAAIRRVGERLAMVKSYVGSTFSNCISLLDDEKDAPIGAPGDDPERVAARKERRAKRLTAQQEKVNRSTAWFRFGNRITGRAMEHPDWFATEEGRKQQSTLVKASVTPEMLRTPAETELLARDFTNCEECASFEKKLMRRFGVRSMQEVPFDRITDAAGQTFGPGPDYETMNRLYRAAEQGDIIRIDGSELIYVGSADTFVHAAPLERYAQRADALLKALQDTESIFSSDTESFTNLRDRLLTIPGELRGLKNSPSNFDRGYRGVARVLQSVAELGKAYQNAHADLTKLSARQIDRLTVIAGLQKLAEEAADEVDTPNGRVYDVAFKITLEQAAVQAGDARNPGYAGGKQALLNYDTLKDAVAALATTDATFSEMMAASSPEDVQHLLEAKPGMAERAYMAFRNRVRPAAPKQELQSPEIPQAKRDPVRRDSGRGPSVPQ